MKVPTHHNVELLLGATYTRHRSREDGRVVALADRVEQFVRVDWQASRIAVGEVVALQDSRDCGLRHERDDIIQVEFAQPVAVEDDLRLRRVEDLVVLVGVSLGIFRDDFGRKLNSRFRAPSRVTDHGREIVQ